MAGQVICFQPQWQWNAPYASMPGCQPCPPYPRPCPGPPPLFGPIVGVIDGSNAAPGMVGEFISATTTVPFAGNPTDTNTTVSLITLPPGDWEVRLKIFPDQNVGGMYVLLSPVPPGLSNDMQMEFYGGQTTDVSSWSSLNSLARASLSVPTLFPFSVTVSQSTNPGGLAGNLMMLFEGRRVR